MSTKPEPALDKRRFRPIFHGVGAVFFAEREGGPHGRQGATEGRARAILGGLPGLHTSGVFNGDVYDENGKALAYGTEAYTEAVIRRIRHYQSDYAWSLKAVKVEPKPIDLTVFGLDGKAK